MRSGDGTMCDCRICRQYRLSEEDVEEILNSDTIAEQIRDSWKPDTIPFVRETDLDEVGETIRCKMSWETGPYRVQHERGTGVVTVGTTELDLKGLSAFIDALECAHGQLLEWG